MCIQNKEQSDDNRDRWLHVCSNEVCKLLSMRTRCSVTVSVVALFAKLTGGSLSRLPKVKSQGSRLEKISFPMPQSARDASSTRCSCTSPRCAL